MRHVRRREFSALQHHLGTVLARGNMGTVIRFDDVVQRPAGEWTPAVHRLLDTLRESGLDQVPEALDIDDSGFELVSYIEGENLAEAAPQVLWSEQILTDAAALLRGIHDRSVDLVDAELKWRSPRREPAEVICHNDFAPYNLIVRDGELAGAIDFDFAAPGPRVWDLAYLAYRLAPYASDSPEASDLDRDRRLRLLLDAYGTDASTRRVLEVMVEVLGALEMHTLGRADATGRGDLYEHAEMYRADADAIASMLSG